MNKEIQENHISITGDTSLTIHSWNMPHLSAKVNAQIGSGDSIETAIVLSTDPDTNMIEFMQLSSGVLKIHSYGNLERMELAKLFYAIAYVLGRSEKVYEKE